jgi:deazaflavin-dependent oxidoreductase (nitroreductase family)
MWFNPIMIWLLKSPLHFFVSKNMMLITYTGRKSGKPYTVPVNYIQDGDMLYTTSWKDRTWWRNLRNGQPVTLRVRGQKRAAIPKVSETNEDVADQLSTYFQLVPNMARYFNVELDPQGNPIQDDIAAAAVPRVMVTFGIQSAG